MTTTTVRERPIIFTAESVRAILNGRKTQMRRALRVPDHPAVADWVLDSEFRAAARPHSENVARQYVTTFPYGRVPCRFGRPGDRLWVREAWCPTFNSTLFRASCADDLPSENTDDWDAPVDDRWRSPLHMPRGRSRLTLEVVRVRVERLHQISRADVLAEGIEPGLIEHYEKFFHKHDAPGLAFAHVWNPINAKRGYGWDTDPWVWVVEFKRATP